MGLCGLGFGINARALCDASSAFFVGHGCGRMPFGKLELGAAIYSCYGGDCWSEERVVGSSTEVYLEKPKARELMYLGSPCNP